MSLDDINFKLNNRTIESKIAMLLKTFLILTRLKKKLKITEPENALFIKVNELKLTHIELFSLFHFMCADSNCF